MVREEELKKDRDMEKRIKMEKRSQQDGGRGHMEGGRRGKC